MPVLQLRWNVLAKTFYLSCNTGIIEANGTASTLLNVGAVDCKLTPSNKPRTLSRIYTVSAFYIVYFSHCHVSHFQHPHRCNTCIWQRTCLGPAEYLFDTTLLWLLLLASLHIVSVVCRRLSGSVTLQSQPAGGFSRAGQAMTSCRLKSPR